MRNDSYHISYYKGTKYVVLLERIDRPAWIVEVTNDVGTLLQDIREEFPGKWVPRKAIALWDGICEQCTKSNGYITLAKGCDHDIY